MIGKWNSLVAAGLLAFGSDASPLHHVKRGTPFDYKNQKVRGVNAGGWFVLEPWITPSFFEDNAAVDEFTLADLSRKDQLPGYEEKLTNHWNTFFTQGDFQQMAAVGLNHVRIPIGYWSINKTTIDDEPYLEHSKGAYEKLGEALDWAQAAGLKVMIDLHGAPGSQNGFDNSGHKTKVGWLPSDRNYDHTKAVLRQIRADHGAHPAVSSIELLNEPLGPNLPMEQVKQFYRDGWGEIKNVPGTSEEEKAPFVVIHDAFQKLSSWNDFNNLDDLVLDTHHYEVFTKDLLSLSPDEHVETACAFGRDMSGNNGDKSTVTGEWTGAMTDCAKWLNGKGVEARWEGKHPDVTTKFGDCGKKSSGTVAELIAEDPDYVTNINKFINAQIAAYELAGGWIFWTWKTEGAPEWDMQALLNTKHNGNSVFPNPVSSFNTGACPVPK